MQFLTLKGLSFAGRTKIVVIRHTKSGPLILKFMHFISARDTSVANKVPGLEIRVMVLELEVLGTVVKIEISLSTLQILEEIGD